MKRISRLGPIIVIHTGQHFEMPEQKRPTCHGFSRCCRCEACLAREKKGPRVALPWEEDYREAA